MSLKEYVSGNDDGFIRFMKESEYSFILGVLELQPELSNYFFNHDEPKKTQFINDLKRAMRSKIQGLKIENENGNVLDLRLGFWYKEYCDSMQWCHKLLLTFDVRVKDGSMEAMTLWRSHYRDFFIHLSESTHNFMIEIAREIGLDVPKSIQHLKINRETLKWEAV